MRRSDEAALAVGPRWRLGDYVAKKSGSSWRGRVVGGYSTDTTPNGYVVESWYERGSVQLWPEAALEDWFPPSPLLR